MKVIYESKYGNVIYYEDKNIVLVIWNSYCELTDYRKILLNALKVIKEHKCNYVVDTRCGFVDNPLDTLWVKDYFMVKTKEYGCKIIYFIIDKDNSLKKELEEQEKDSNKLLEFKYIYDLDEI